MFRRSELARPDVVGVLRRATVAYADGLGADRSVCDAVALAVSEALNNAVVHAYVDVDTGPVHVEAWDDHAGSLVVRVTDEGLGMVPRPDSPGLGLGLSLMAQMADDVQVASRPESTGTIVSMRFALGLPD